MKRETIVRFWIELEKLRPVRPSLYCSTHAPIRVVALCGDRYSQCCLQILKLNPRKCLLNMEMFSPYVKLVVTSFHLQAVITHW